MPQSFVIEDLLRAVDRAYQEQRFGEAEEHCGKALELAPENPQALLMQSVLAARRGDLNQAIESSRKAVNSSPDFREANIKLAGLLRQAGQTAEAISACEQFIRRSPRDAVAHGLLGLCQMDRGRYAEAAECFKRAVALDPKNVRFRQNLAGAFARLGRGAEAEAIHRESIATSGSQLESDMSVGLQMLSKGRVDEAITAYRRALEVAPDSFEVNLQLGSALGTAGRSEEAHLRLQHAIELRPNHGGAYATLGGILQEMGRFDEALACFEKAMDLEPRRASLYLRIANSKKLKEADRPMIARMHELLANPDLSYPDRRALHSALGKACDDLGDYEQVLPHLDEAARIAMEHPNPKDRPFDRRLDDARVEFLIKTFDEKFFKTHRGQGSESDVPILIIGSPRSGTTLLDQILSRHSDIGSAGEQLFWAKNSQPAFESLARDLAKTQKIASEYLVLLRGFGPDKRRIVDKMPTNYAAAPLIHALFPKARFIHIRRHPVDTCISLHMNANSMAVVPFGRTRRDIVYGYKNYLRVMDHLRKVLPDDRLFELDYEALVADKEAATRAVIEFCGLEWDEACLDHQANTRYVGTPSLWQVRQPVYSTSVERWRNYEPWLGEFRDLL